MANIDLELANVNNSFANNSLDIANYKVNAKAFDKIRQSQVLTKDT